MQILLRKVRGISGLTPVLRTATGRSFGAGAPAGSVTAALTSRPMLMVIAIALAVTALLAWFTAGHPMVSHEHSLMFLPFAGSLAAKIKETDDKMAAKSADAARGLRQGRRRARFQQEGSARARRREGFEGSRREDAHHGPRARRISARSATT
jgi:hypothetical protein